MDAVTIAVSNALATNHTASVALNGVSVKNPQIDPLTKSWQLFSSGSNDYIDTGIVAEGKDGQTPYIGDNGNWFFGTYDTGVRAVAEDVTSFQEEDPTVPAWAKQMTKPTYTATEVGAATPADVEIEKNRAESAEALLQANIDTETKTRTDQTAAFVNDIENGINTVKAYTNTKLTEYLTEDEVYHAIEEKLAEIGKQSPDIDLSQYETTAGAVEKMEAAVEMAKAHTDTEASKKVDKVSGKGLSANDFTNELKTRLETVLAEKTALEAEIERATKAENALGTAKLDKTGQAADSQKLGGELPSVYLRSDDAGTATQSKNGLMASTDKTKLDSITKISLSVIAGETYTVNLSSYVGSLLFLYLNHGWAGSGSGSFYQLFIPANSSLTTTLLSVNNNLSNAGISVTISNGTLTIKNNHASYTVTVNYTILKI